MTLGMIVRNEERLLPQCLAPIHEDVAEVIIVDDGSTDGTRDVASRYGARVVGSLPGNDPYRNRNIYLELATQPWILCLDADERIAVRDVPRLAALVRRTDADAFWFCIRNYNDELNLLREWRPRAGEYEKEEAFAGTNGWFTTRSIRLIRRDPLYRYEGAGPHVSLAQGILRRGARAREAPFPIHHFEVLKGERAIAKKQRAYLRASLRGLRDSPDPKAHLDIALGLFRLGRDGDAILHLKASLRANAAYMEAHKHLGMVYQQTGDYASALRHVRVALRLAPQDADLHCLLGRALLARGQARQALGSLTRAQHYQPGHPVAAHLRGVAHECLGHMRIAQRWYRRSLSVLPSYSPARSAAARLARVLEST